MADLFNSDPTKVQEVLKELVGEGKKFKTVEDLAKGKLESDTFIEQLKSEQAALRLELAAKEEKVKEAATLKELMDKLDKAKPNSTGKEETTPLSRDELKKMFLDTVEERDKSTARTSNRAKANEVLLGKFGGDAEKASTYVASKAKELGLTKEALGELSETSPNAFTQLLGLQGTSSSQSGTVNSMKTVNTEAFIPSGNGAKDISYYAELRKKDSKAFFAPKTQQEIFKFGQEHGLDALKQILNG
jgi:hypothetical protein